ncbi:MAG: triose-phosphate isomerase [Pseudohongiellaceae bacterium]
MRRKLVAGNWKMHGSRQFVRELLQDLVERLGELPRQKDIAVCPATIHLPLAAQQLQGSSIALGAQNVYCRSEGAFTGEVSAPMLVEYGVRFVLVGHSERRQLFAETDELVAEKFAAVQAQGITPVLCLGETLTQREQDKTTEVVLRQLVAVVDLVGVDRMIDSVIAYEPVWAIGTGRTATPDQAQEVHAMIREYLRSRQKEVADRVRIVYGGSVNPGNAAALFAQQDIDGGLVGGASLKPDDFASICRALD